MYLPTLINIPQIVLNLFPTSNFDTQLPIAVPVYRPVVVWHGLGDNYNSSGIHKVQEIFDGFYPGIYVHSINLDENPSSDQQKSFFGDINLQIDQVCQSLQNVTELQHGFDAIGFSQGGIMLRGLLERCENVKIETLITFGSPHFGVSELPLCKNPKDWLCKKRNELLKKQVWYDSVQKRVIPAQYFRDPVDLDKYLQHSNYLADINNERDEKNQTYKKNFSQLEKLVLVSFTEDTTVVPKESSKFYDYDPERKVSIPFDQTKLYLEDFIGLKSLHSKGAVDFLSIEADHMDISEDFIRNIAGKYVGSKIV